MKSKIKLNFKNSNRIDFWNMNINPITGYCAVVSKGTIGDHSQPELKADYGPTIGII